MTKKSNKIGVEPKPKHDANSPGAVSVPKTVPRERIRRLFLQADSFSVVVVMLMPAGSPTANLSFPHLAIFGVSVRSKLKGERSTEKKSETGNSRAGRIEGGTKEKKRNATG